MSFLPFHIIATHILTRLPVKSLLKYKSISKEWAAAISDPAFTEAHLLQSRKNRKPDRFAWDGDELHVIELGSDRFQPVSTLEYPPALKYNRTGVKIVCHCDGLYLFVNPQEHDSMYFLWNPSNRSYKLFHCPYPMDLRPYRKLHGIWYDPRTKDYRVVVADFRNYAVYHCRSNTWSDLKGFDMDLDELYSQVLLSCNGGNSVDGFIFWFVINGRGEEDGDLIRYCVEIIKFDERIEELTKFAILDGDYDYVTSIGEFSSSIVFVAGNMMTIILKKNDWLIEDERIEFRKSYHLIPISCTSDYEVILEDGNPDEWLLCNPTTKRIKNVKKIPEASRTGTLLFPYHENLFSFS